MELYENGARWIWGYSRDSVSINTYYEFVKNFASSGDNKKANLRISVDSNYALFINKKFVDCGQYHDYKNKKSYDTIDISRFVVSGENEIYITAHYQGVDSFQYVIGSPKLIYEVEIDNGFIVSDNSTLCREFENYRQEIMPRTSSQLGFTYEYNADALRKSDWKQSTEIDSTDITLKKRPNKKLIIKSKASTKLIAQGVFERKNKQENIFETVAKTMHMDYISARHSWDMIETIGDSFKIKSGLVQNTDDNGVYLVFDISYEETGYFNMCLSANKGAVVDISYGQHLDDLRVRSEVGGRNFSNRYICKEGFQEFTHYFSRLSGRYIQLHISNIDSSVLCINYVGVLPIQYDMAKRGQFRCNDSLHNKIYDVAKRTLDLCMHEHYEDTPWREQALYAMDSRNQALCGYYCFGEYDFAKAAFSLFLDSTTTNGYMQLCAPCEFKRTIPYFSYMWIIEVAEYVMYSGDVEYVGVVYDKIKDMIVCYLSQMSNGMIQRLDDDWHWHFYEWTDGLDGDISEEDRKKNIGRIDAPQNMFFSVMLDKAQILAKVAGDTEFCDILKLVNKELKEQTHKTFWDNEKELYITYVNTKDEKLTNNYAELTQSLAIYSDICPQKLKKELRKKLADRQNGLVKVSLSHSIFRYEALLQDASEYAQFVFGEVLEIWGDMLFSGATSFWETSLGADDFGGAGSLCHGWSAVPVFLYHAYLMGVKPTEIGFTKYSIDPVYLDGMKVSGIVPTPANIDDIYVK